MVGEKELTQPNNRRTVLKRMGVGAVGLSAVASARAASATESGRSADRALRPSLELAIGNESWGSFEEAKDYHNIDNSKFSGFDVQLTVYGASGSTLICHTGVLQGSDHVKDAHTIVEGADDPHVDYHSYTTGLLGSMEGRYTLFGVVADGVHGSATTAAVDFTVR